MNEKRIISLIMAMISVIAFNIGISHATISVEGISTDPAIISAGDEVDIIVNFEDKSASFESDVSRFTDDGNYNLHVWIEPSDTVSEDYLTLLDADGDRNIGHLFSGDVWRKNFRIRVADDAPVGNYELKALFQYEKDGRMLDGIQEKFFTINVKKEGIVLNLAGISTIPSQIKPGDTYIDIMGNLENSGLKNAKNAVISLDLPEGFEDSYSNSNRVYIGLVGAQSSKSTSFTIDVDEKTTPGEYTIGYHISYQDSDNNQYTKNLSFPLFIKEKPIIEVVGYEGEGLAGSDSTLKVYVKNNGLESAESVDVRLIKQNSQPFDFDVRSNYVGELKPGEESVAVFDIDINSDAQLKEHDFKILIRAKGDSDKGDDNIYIYNRRAKFDVVGTAPNNLLRAGSVIGVALAAVLFINFLIRKNR